MTCRLALVLGLLLLLPACSTTEVRGERIDTDLLEQAAQALVHQLARELVERPEVVCAESLVSNDGVPGEPATEQAVTLVTRGLTPAQRTALVLEVGRRIWTSPAPTVGGASVLVLDEAGGSESDLGRLLEQRRGTAGAAALAERFGPRPTPPPLTTPLPDPGDPGCP